MTVDTLRAYWKVIVAGVGALVVALQSANSDNVIDTGEKLLIVAAFFGAVLVGIVGNPTLPFWKYSKFVVEVAAGVAGYLALEWTNGAAELTTAQWIGILLIAVTALGVGAVPGPQLRVTGTVIEGREVPPPG